MYKNSILTQFPGVDSVSEVPFHAYSYDQRNFPKVDNVVHGRKTLISSAVNLVTAGAAGTVLATLPAFVEDAVEIQEFFVRYTADMPASPTTAGAITVKILPSGSAAVARTLDEQYKSINGLATTPTIWNPFAGGEPKLTLVASAGSRAITMKCAGAYYDKSISGMPTGIDFREGSIIYPWARQGEAVQFLVAVQGVTATQTVEIGIRYQEVLPERVAADTFTPSTISFS